MSKSKGRKKDAPAHGESREAILRAVITIVAREGLDALTFRSLAAEAGVAGGLAPYHFGSREAMLGEALLLCVKEHQERVDAAFSAKDLDGFARGIPELIEEISDKAAFQFLMLLNGAGQDERVEETYDIYIEAMRGALAKLGAGADEALASLVFAVIDGLVLQQLVYRDPERTEAALEVLRTLLRSQQQ